MENIAHDLKSEVRVEASRRRLIFETIDRWKGEGWDDVEIIKRLINEIHAHNGKEAWQWLKRYYEHKMLKDEAEYIERTRQLSIRIDQINLKLARREY